MKRNVQLTIFNESMPGLNTAYRITQTGMEWLRDPTPEEFKAVDQVCQVISRIDAWLMGALIGMYVRMVKSDNPSASVKSAIHDFAQARGMNPDVCHEQYCVDQFYPHALRLRGLHWSHYRIVWAAGVRPLSKAIEWLQRCSDGQWTAEKLRAELRNQASRPDNHEPQVPGFFPPELQRTEDWCSGQLHCVEQIPNDAAERLLKCMSGTVQFIDALRAKVAQPVAGG